jgi:D-apiose dehydrogenase
MPHRVAVVGAGYFAAFHHDGWSRIPGAALSAICDADPAKAEAAAGRHGAQAFTDLSAMLAAVTPDLLDIAIPPAGHAAAIRAGLAAGVPTIVCQKPFCRDLAEAEAVVAEAEVVGVLLVVHENFRFQPWYRETARQIAAGALGTLASLSFRLRPGDGGGPDAYLARQPYFRAMPRFLVRETGVHFIDVFRFLLGEVEAVFADLRRLNSAIAGEDCGSVLFRMAGGARALFDGNRLADHVARDRRLTMGEMLLEGSEAALRLDGEGRLFLRRFGSNEEHPVPFAWSAEGFAGDSVRALQQHVVAHLDGAGPIENTARAYLANLRIEAAVYRAAESGCWQNL